VNLGLFAYPFAQAVWGVDGLRAIMLFDLPNQIVLLVVSYVAMFVRARDGADSLREVAFAAARRLLNPCMLALAAAFALASTGLGLPSPLGALTAPLVAANAPLALLALGCVLDFSATTRERLCEAAMLLFARFGVSLAVAAGAAAFLSGLLPADTLAVVALAMTAPVPMLTLTYSAELGLDVAQAALLVNSSMLLSFGALLAIVNLAGSAVLAPAAAAASAASLLASAAAARALGWKRGNERAAARSAPPVSASLSGHRPLRRAELSIAGAGSPRTPVYLRVVRQAPSGAALRAGGGRGAGARLQRRGSAAMASCRLALRI